jgi:hypothetical protein
MDIAEERANYKLNEEQQARLDKYIGAILSIIAGEEGHPAVLMGMDKVYRSYMEWLTSARHNNVDAETARSASLHIISTQIMELSNQMVDHDTQTADRWLSDFIHDFMYDLRVELIHDLQATREAKNRTTQ